MSENNNDEFDEWDGADELDDDEEEEFDAAALAASSRAGEEIDDEEADELDLELPALKQIRAASTVSATLGQMLTGALPMFIVHKSHNHSAMIPEVFSVARRYVRGQAGLGVAVRLPSISSEAAATFMEGTQAALRIADPEIHTIPNAEAPATNQPAKATKNHSWMKEIPAKLDGPWIDKVIDAQVRADANVFLSASGWVSEINAVKNLEAQMAWVRATRTALGESQPMFVNLTLPGVWLSNAELRSSLKQEMNESNERLWWLRFYWPKVPVRYGQLLDGDVLDGYRDVAGNAGVEDKVVVFPNSGLTGWLATAWGGQGFSTGTSWTQQQYSEPVIAMTPKDTPRARLPSSVVTD